jgi:hypothetical protein
MVLAWAVAVVVGGQISTTVILILAFGMWGEPLPLFWLPVLATSGLALLLYKFLRWFAEIEERMVIKGEIETCCRRCDYILRGIPEPRCPECGERI